MQGERKAVGRTVLIVEDNRLIRKLIAAAFTAAGFAQCFEADNGRQGIELAKQIHPDLITFDLSMPGMNGLETAAELRKPLLQIPTILFTSFVNETPHFVAAKSGISLVLSKGVSLSTFVAHGHTLIDQNS